jgi:ribosomal protein S15P/S13E
MERELADRVCDWHGGQWTHTYALCSTGQAHLVSLSMLDAAIDELVSVMKRGPKDRRSKKELRDLIGDLQMLRQYWKESSAKEYGIEAEGYDTADYGYDADEESKLP